MQYPSEAFRPDSSSTSQLLEHLPAVRLRMQRESGTVSQQTATLAFERALHSASSIPSSLKPTILSDLSHYYQFCTRLRIPAYPITPDRVALHLARFVSLPHGSGSATEEVRRATGTISLRSTRELEFAFYSLKVAGIATAGLWRTTESFVGEPGDYWVTKEVAQGLDRFVFSFLVFLLLRVEYFADDP
ncbi:hypothetical protein RQP46_009724 [Phenoliferia psychrophenolica]